MVSKLNLLPVEWEDKTLFLQVALQHFRELNPDFVPHSDWTMQYFEQIMNSQNVTLQWIDVEGERVGFILFGIEDHRFLPRKTGMIYELHIMKPFRRRGIAEKCAEAVVKQLQSFGVSKIQLEVVEGNSSAAALWRKIGFAKVAERYVMTGESAV